MKNSNPLYVQVTSLLYQRGTGVVCFSFFFSLRVLESRPR